MNNRKRTVLQRFAEAILNLFGWKLEIEQMPPERAVLIGAHHTSAWDVPLALLLLIATGTSFALIVKKEQFVGPLGWLLRALKCVPIDRSKRNNFVQQIVEILQGPVPIRIGLGPEGTRHKTRYWKTGFYYMALGAGVPISFGYVDYPRRIVGFGPTIMPSGDIEADMAIIRAFYSKVAGKYPEKQSDIQIAPPGIVDELRPKLGRKQPAFQGIPLREYMTLMTRLPVAVMVGPRLRAREAWDAIKRRLNRSSES